MSSYIRELERERVRAETEAAEAKEHKAKQIAAERYVPLDARLRRLLNTIPVGIQQQGLELEFLRSSLIGRSGRKCHSGELGVALRKLHYSRSRAWRGHAGFRALWFPPTEGLDSEIE